VEHVHVPRSELASDAEWRGDAGSVTSANAIAQHNRRGWRIGKPTKETNIDGIVAFCMALDRLENRPEPVRLIGWL
jgi:hypothetical protein